MSVSVFFRSNTFDGLICVAVLHHLATQRRRVSALKELSRVLAVGGKLLVTVCAVGEKQDEVFVKLFLTFQVNLFVLIKYFFLSS